MSKVPLTNVSITSIRNARNADGTGGTTSNTFSVLRDGAVFGLFDPTYLAGATTLSQINTFGQFRNYPVDKALGLFNAQVEKILIQPDGKILVGGAFSTYNGTTRNRIIRLNLDGSIDTTFNIGTGFNFSVYAMALQSDGKIVVGGEFTSYDGLTGFTFAPVGFVSFNRIIRLNTNGSYDSTFNGFTSAFNSNVRDIAIDSSGKIYVVGNFTTHDGVSANRIIRLNSDGSRDTAFNVGTGFNAIALKIKLFGSNAVFVAGGFTSYRGATWNRLVKLFTDGQADGFSFQQNAGFNNTVNAIDIQADGKILCGGDFTSHNTVPTIDRFCRLNSNNTLDTWTRFNDVVYDIKIYDSSNNMLLGGAFTTSVDLGVSANKIIMLNSSLGRNNSFDYGTGFTGELYTFAVESNGNIIAGGFTTNYKGQSIGYIVRLKPNGDKI